MCKFISTDYPAEHNAHFWEKKHTKMRKKKKDKAVSQEATSNIPTIFKLCPYHPH